MRFYSKLQLFGTLSVVFTYFTLSRCSDPPQIQPFSFPEAQSVGQKTSLTCTLNKGTSPLTFSWSKDGKELTNVGNTKVRSIDDLSVLSVDPVQQDSGGNYTCTVTNSAGRDQYMALLVVKAPPKWILKPSDLTTYLGTKLVIDCQVTGQPMPSISWYKEDSQGNKEKLNSNVRLVISLTGQLVISDVKETDDGRYGCEANNGVQQSLYSSFMLTVHGKQNSTFFATDN